MKAKKIIIPVSIIAGVAAIGVAIAALGSSASTVAYADTIKIQAKTIENKISVSGTVKSAEVTKVYSELSYPVEKVNVSVGDAVKKGDVLCTIRTDDLQQQILQQQYTVDSSGLNEEYTLSNAEQKYNDALEMYENGDNPTIKAAKDAVEKAEKALEDAKEAETEGIGTTLPETMETAEDTLKRTEKAYNESVANYEKALKEIKPESYPTSVKKVYKNLTELEERLDIVSTTNPDDITELKNARARYSAAKSANELLGMDAAAYSASEAAGITAEFTAAKTELAEMEAKYDRKNIEEQLEAARIQYESAVDGLEKALDLAEAEMESAEIAYRNAQKGQQKAEKSNKTSKDDYSDAVKNAEKALDDAKKNYDLAVQQVEADLASLKKAAEQQRTLSGLGNPQLTILENLKGKLEYAVVVAPCDGVVTAVNTEEGVMATGALFVIEDLSNLKVSASVGEYDIPYVGEGMTATVKCDAVSGVEYDGKVSSVAPTGIPGSTGTSYAIEADIDGEDGKILVGMSAKLAIISDKRENALTITYDALTTDENGNDAVYIAEKDENGVYHAKLVTVEIGLETDYEIEIISDEISEGMYVLTNTTMLSDGDMVMINETEETAETEQVAE